MKYCSQCGAQTKDDAKFCEYCGNQFVVVDNNDKTKEDDNYNYYQNDTNINNNSNIYESNNNNYQEESTGIGICALVFSFFIPLVGIILGILCLSKGKTNKTLGTAALIISIVSIVISIALYSTGIIKF